MKLYNYCFSVERRSRVFVYLVLWNMLIIGLSNYIGRFPVHFYVVYNTLSAFIFPILFITANLAVRFFGKGLALRVVTATLVPGMLVAYMIFLTSDLQWAEGWGYLLTVNPLGLRIACAGAISLFVAQIFNIYVFHHLRYLNIWWIAPVASSLVAALVDSLLFFSLAFYRSRDIFMAENWLDLGVSDFIIKILIILFILLPIYSVLVKILNLYLYKKSQAAPLREGYLTWS